MIACCPKGHLLRAKSRMGRGPLTLKTLFSRTFLTRVFATPCHGMRCSTQRGDVVQRRDRRDRRDSALRDRNQVHEGNHRRHEDTEATGARSREGPAAASRLRRSAPLARIWPPGRVSPAPSSAAGSSPPGLWQQIHDWRKEIDTDSRVPGRRERGRSRTDRSRRLMDGRIRSSGAVEQPGAAARPASARACGLQCVPHPFRCLQSSVVSPGGSISSGAESSRFTFASLRVSASLRFGCGYAASCAAVGSHSTSLTQRKPSAPFCLPCGCSRSRSPLDGISS